MSHVDAKRTGPSLQAKPAAAPPAPSSKQPTNPVGADHRLMQTAATALGNVRTLGVHSGLLSNNPAKAAQLRVSGEFHFRDPNHAPVDQVVQHAVNLVLPRFGLPPDIGHVFSSHQNYGNEGLYQELNGAVIDNSSNEHTLRSALNEWRPGLGDKLVQLRETLQQDKAGERNVGPSMERLVKALRGFNNLPTDRAARKALNDALHAAKETARAHPGYLDKTPSARDNLKSYIAQAQARLSNTNPDGSPVLHKEFVKDIGLQEDIPFLRARLSKLYTTLDGKTQTVVGYEVRGPVHPYLSNVPLDSENQFIVQDAQGRPIKDPQRVIELVRASLREFRPNMGQENARLPAPFHKEREVLALAPQLNQQLSRTNALTHKNKPDAVPMTKGNVLDTIARHQLEMTDAGSRYAHYLTEVLPTQPWLVTTIDALGEEITGRGDPVDQLQNEALQKLEATYALTSQGKLTPTEGMVETIKTRQDYEHRLSKLLEHAYGVADGRVVVADGIKKSGQFAAAAGVTIVTGNPWLGASAGTFYYELGATLPEPLTGHKSQDRSLTRLTVEVAQGKDSFTPQKTFNAALGTGFAAVESLIGAYGITTTMAGASMLAAKTWVKNEALRFGIGSLGSHVVVTMPGQLGLTALKHAIDPAEQHKTAPQKKDEFENQADLLRMGSVAAFFQGVAGQAFLGKAKLSPTTPLPPSVLAKQTAAAFGIDLAQLGLERWSQGTAPTSDEWIRWTITTTTSGLQNMAPHAVKPRAARTAPPQARPPTASDQPLLPPRALPNRPVPEGKPTPETLPEVKAGEVAPAVVTNSTQPLPAKLDVSAPQNTGSQPQRRSPGYRLEGRGNVQPLPDTRLAGKVRRYGKEYQLDLSKEDLRHVADLKTQLATIEQVRPGLRIDLNGANLRGMDLSDMPRALRFADFRGADMQGANLAGTDLTGARLSRSNLFETDFTGANLQAADLSHATADAAIFDKARVTANFSKASLVNAHFIDANLTEANLSGSNLKLADLSGASLFRADLRGANLQIADLRRAYLLHADLSDAQLTDALLGEALLTGVDLSGADLQRTDLTGATLLGSNLTGANLSNSKLLGAHFGQAKLQGSNLEGADLTRADLRAANLEGARWHGANTYQTKLTETQKRAADRAGAISSSERPHHEQLVLTDPMRPIPNLKTLRENAINSEELARLRSELGKQGLEYQGTGVVVNVRHGKTNYNAIPGGFFAGAVKGPYGAQLLAASEDAARALQPEIRAISQDIQAVFVSPVDRATATYRLAVSGIDNLPTALYRQWLEEHHVGMLAGQTKPVPGAVTRRSNVLGVDVGKDYQGKLGKDKNRLDRDYVPGNYPGLPNTPLTGKDKSESWLGMLQRVESGVNQDFLPILAKGGNILAINHQFNIGHQDAVIFKDRPGQARIANDPLKTGHDLPNTAPQYWVVYVFKDAKGNLVPIPATAGQGQLSAPTRPQPPDSTSRSELPKSPSPEDAGTNLQGKTALEPKPTDTPEKSANPSESKPSLQSFLPQRKDAPVFKRVTAQVGTPLELPSVARPERPRLPLSERLPVQIDIGKDLLGQFRDAKLNQFIWKPIDRHITRPAVNKALSLINQILDTPGGRKLSQTATTAKDAVSALIAQDTPLGKAVDFVDQHVVRNTQLWNAVDTAGKAGRDLIKAGAVGTVAAIATAARTGHLKTGEFRSGGNLTPEQLEIVRAVNIPPNVDVRYWKVEGRLPVVVDGRTYSVPTRAFIAVGGGNGVVLLPSTGPGKPGAQPWFGRDGTNPSGNTLTATASSVAAANWNVLGFSFGTTNLNVGGRFDLQLLRGLVNPAAVQIPEQKLVGKPPVSAKSIAIFDLFSTFVTGSVNVGPAAFVPLRVRNPQTEHLVWPDPGRSVPLNKSHPSVVQPAVPLSGSTTWDATAEDVQLVKALFGAEKSPEQFPGILLESATPNATSSQETSTQTASASNQPPTLSAVARQLDDLRVALKSDDLTRAKTLVNSLQAEAAQLAHRQPTIANRARSYSDVAQQLLRDEQAHRSSAAARHIEMIVNRRQDNQPTRRPEAVLPRGVSRLPPDRPENFDFAEVSAATIARALDVLESNAYPMSDPSYGHRLADGVFGTLWKAMDLLGSREVTMAELQGMLTSNLQWQSKADTGVRSPEELDLVFARDNALVSHHELHFILGGFRGVPDALGEFPRAGMGGENGLFARVTDEFDDQTPDEWGKEREIFAFWSKKIIDARRNPTNIFAGSYWSDLQNNLASGSDDEVTSSHLKKMGSQGYFADPRQRELLRPFVDTILAYPPSAPERIEAAKRLVRHLSDRAHLNDTVSVSAATAEMQVLETMYSYLKANRLSVREPSHTIDVVQLYQEYLNLLQRGELTDRETVERWLKTYVIPHIP
jgi:uncharacterized protein YjbI with pentapeptide repeats/bisphosphoglycerate-dependent phosphoglycerate mutase